MNHNGQSQGHVIRTQQSHEPTVIHKVLSRLCNTESDLILCANVIVLTARQMSRDRHGENGRSPKKTNNNTPDHPKALMYKLLKIKKKFGQVGWGRYTFASVCLRNSASNDKYIFAHAVNRSYNFLVEHDAHSDTVRNKKCLHL